MRVTILNVDPGGCRLSRPMPATARICPLEGAIATIPPNWPPSAATAARCSAGETVLRTGGAGWGATEASTRVPASSSPPGAPAQAVVERPLEAAHADVRVGRHPFGFERLAAGGAESGRRCPPPRSPLPRAASFGGPGARGRAFRAFGEHGPVAGQQRRPPRQRGVAREQLTRTQAGERERARPGDALAFAAFACDLQLEVERQRAEQVGAHAHRHRDQAARDVVRLAGDPHARWRPRWSAPSGRRRRIRRPRPSASRARRCRRTSSRSRAVTRRARTAPRARARRSRPGSRRRSRRSRTRRPPSRSPGARGAGACAWFSVGER